MCAHRLRVSAARQPSYRVAVRVPVSLVLWPGIFQSFSFSFSLSLTHRHTKLSNNDDDDVVFYLFILRVFCLKMEMVYRQLSNIWKLCCRGALSSTTSSPFATKCKFELSSISVFWGSVFSIFFFSPLLCRRLERGEIGRRFLAREEGQQQQKQLDATDFHRKHQQMQRCWKEKNAQDVRRDDADDRSGP